MRWRLPHREPPSPPDEEAARLEVLDGDDPAIVGRPDRFPRPTPHELAYAGPERDPGGTAGLWSAIEHL